MANKVIDPAPIIKQLADRCLKSKGLECSVLGRVIDLLKAAPAVDDAPYWATERAYKNGYEAGKKDALTKIPVTNADRIRAMSDEELAKFIGHNSLCDQIQNDNGAWCKKQSVCEGCLIEWLKQPAEGE